VAVNVKVIDINLSGNNITNSSFSFGINNNFFVNDGGAASLNFGGFNPPRRDQAVTGLINRPVIPNPIGEAPFFEPNGRLLTIPLTAPGGGLFVQPRSPVSEDPTQVGVQNYEVFERDFTTGAITSYGEATFSQFPLFQYPRRFLSTLQAQIQTQNAKILTDPTLVVQEGETAQVNITEEVVTNIRTETEITEGLTTRRVTAEKGFAGLRLGVGIDRIDDNGFVSLRVNPIVSAVGASRPLGSDAGAGNFISLLQERSLQSGLIRLRDGQTLIVSGIIRDNERVTASKIPILGDLPIIGSLFRRTDKTNERAEVVVLLTPQILDDSDRSNFGYQNNISPDARQLLQRSQPVQPRQ